MSNTFMLFHRVCLVAVAAASLSLPPRFAQAQAVTDINQATAVRDSVLRQANPYRQLIEQRATGFDVKAFRLAFRGKGRLFRYPRLPSSAWRRANCSGVGVALGAR
ncbi:hypothetical protein GCM10028821_09830 [Hymenobacter jeollabukensis]